MEKINISKFLVIDNADIEIGQFTILIGPQANGKSIVAKLIYFFRNFLKTEFTQSIQKLQTLRELNKSALLKFEEIFPRYTWVNNHFIISYTQENINIEIRRDKSTNGKISTELIICEELKQVHRKLKSAYKKKIQNISIEQNKNIDEIFRDFLSEKLKTFDKTNVHSNFDVFIPAGRSFFANLQKNVFSFLSSNIEIDPFLKRFGSTYESVKSIYRNNILIEKHKNELEIVNQLVSSIISGEYLHEDDQDWIVSGKKRINLSNSSSGQQEALPMLLILSTLPFFVREKNSMYFIEEPEAHLFPFSQKKIINLLSYIHNKTNCKFLMTTHSPYILTAINNLLLAHSTYNSVPENLKKDVNSLVSKDLFIDFKDICAYSIQNGKVEKILEKDNQLISTNIIDNVSDIFNEEFDNLLTLKYSE